jgi:hypothetical protein
MPPQLGSWRPAVRRRLPFTATLVYSSDDPFGGPERALDYGDAWGATPVAIGAAGHINADSGLGDWPAGFAELAALAAR